MLFNTGHMPAIKPALLSSALLDFNQTFLNRHMDRGGLSS